MRPQKLPRLFARDPQRPRVPIDSIILTPRQKLIRNLDAYCREHGTTFAEIRRDGNLSRCKIGQGSNESTRVDVFRGLIFYLRETKKMSYPHIGMVLGKDHATIQYHHKPGLRAKSNERRASYDQTIHSVSCLTAAER